MPRGTEPRHRPSMLGLVLMLELEPLLELAAGFVRIARAPRTHLSSAMEYVDTVEAEVIVKKFAERNLKKLLRLGNN